LAPVTFSPRAVEKLERRRTKIHSWYLDLRMIRDYWGQARFYHHTAPVNMLYALAAALEVIFSEGLEARFARHREAHLALRKALEAQGLRYLSREGFHLPMLNAVGVPDGVDDSKVRRRLLDEQGIEIGGGLGAFKGKGWRIGLMGHNARLEVVNRLLAALARLLK
jgi:alanine-glyoxylate transaminase/serine-glyoxylate transaminase/serine-pyruvate transaminase